MTISEIMWRFLQVTETSHLDSRKSWLALPSLFVRALAGFACRLNQPLASLNGRHAAHQVRLLALLVSLIALASSTAVAVTPHISAGGGHSLFLKSGGSVWASGDNGSGGLGDGTTANQSTPVQVMSGVAAISAGGYQYVSHSLFLMTDGTVWASGSNAYGQLGDGTTTDRSTPVQVMSGVVAISAGKSHSLFLKSDGSAWASGRNNGALGDGTTGNRHTPVQVLSGVAAISAGGSHSLFLKTDGSVWATGLNTYGELGAFMGSQRVTPAQVMSGVAAISAGGSHSLFLKIDGSVWATGASDIGQLGDGGAGSQRYTPVQVMSEVAAISAGAWHSLFLKTDGSVWATGANSYGQLGDGTTTDRSMPAQVMSEVAAISAGMGHTLFLKSDGSAWATGLNLFGQLGDGTTTNRSTPFISFWVGPTAQTITFPAIADRLMTSPTVALTGAAAATSSSGLAITYSVVSGPATLSGTTLTLTGAGTVTVRAAQVGNATYAAASSVDQSFTVSAVAQTITFPALSSRPLALSITLTASSTSGLPVIYTVLSGPATVSGSTLSVTGVGTITLRASQAGNATYLPATDVTSSLTITPNAATPANLGLSQTWFYDSAAINSAVGQLSATDADVGDTLTYTLVSGTGATDNAKFALVGASLRTAATFAYETLHSASIRVRATDGAGQFVEQSFTLVIIDATPFARFTDKGSFIEAPCYINAVFQLSDQAGQGVNLPRSFIDQNAGLFRVRENGALISSSESFVQIGKLDEVPSVIKTVLLIDNSFSLGTQLADVRAAAKSFVDLMQPNQEIAIYSFAGAPVLRQGYTRNKTMLNAAIDAIALGATTTNLYGSIYELLDAPDGVNPTRWTESASLTGITTGFLVVFTDGSDQSGLRTEAEVTALRDGQKKKVFTLGMGASVDAGALTRLGNAGYKSLAVATDLSAALTDIQNSIRDNANSYYWLNYASPKRGNFTRTLTVELFGNQNTGSDKLLTTTFNSATLSDLTPGVFINRTVYKANGDVSLSMAKGESQTVLGSTLYSLYPQSEYIWSVGNGGMASLAPVAGTYGAQLVLTAGNLDCTTSLTLTDTVNGYSLTIPLMIGTGIGIPPAAPSGLAAHAVSGTQLSLNWLDNAADESGYKLERSLDGSTGWEQIATRSANATTYTDSALAVGASYFYRIKSTNANGDSAPSAVAVGTTWSVVQDWLSSQGLPAGTELTVDSDRDGLPNLLEYALGGSPTDAASAIHPLTAISADHLTLSYTRVRADIVYAVEASSNLVDWVPVTYAPVAIGQTQTVTDTVAISAGGRRFIRLGVTLVP